MLSVSSDFLTKIKSNERQFSVKLTFLPSTVLTGTTIRDITLDEVINSADVLTMGCACSNKLSVNLINAPSTIDYANTPFTAEVGLTISGSNIEWVNLGKFYASEVETKNDFKNLKITAYDGFFKMSGKYNATVEENTTLQAVYNDLKTQLLQNCGITLKAKTLQNYNISSFKFLDITYIQAIGYVAGCLGGMARFARDGELEIVWYSDSHQTIDRSLQYMGGFKRNTSKPLTITSIATGTKDSPIVKGSGSNGTQISFTNEYITDAMAEDIYTAVNGLTYTPCEVQWRGNPAIQAGDIVSAWDKDDVPQTVLVMSQSLKIGGGLNAQITCSGKSNTTSEFSNAHESVGKKIERVYTTLERAILDATNAITGNSGGYVKLIDTNGDSSPDEIVILDIDDLSLATKVWRWNKEGLGYSHNASGGAYNGAYATAITANGQINADFITTGTLQANRIAVESFDTETSLLTDYIHFSDGTMTFGKADNAITLKLENDKIAFYRQNTQIAKFTNNSFEIDNLTEGKIRFQNFGFIPRTNGNITFTKLV